MTDESAQLQRLSAFNRVGLKIQEALNVNDILRVMGEGLREIGFNGVVMFLDEEQKNLKIEYVFFAPSLLASLEKLFGIEAIGFKVPVESGEAFRVVERERRTVFTSRLVDGLEEVFPSLFAPLASRPVEMLGLGNGRGIYTPLITRGKILGVLMVWSPDTSEEDIPTVVAFANQAAIAIDNARLISESEVEAEERKRSEKKYIHLLEDINDGYVVINQEGIITFANRRFGEICGYKPAQVLGKSLADFVAPDKREAVIEEYGRVIRNEEKTPERREAVCMKQDGATIIVESNIKAIEYEGKPAFSVVVRDITERKRAEEELRESQEIYKSLVETAGKAGEGIIIAQNVGNVEGIVVFANDELLRIAGYTREELIGNTIQELFPPNSISEWMDRYRRRQSGEELPSYYEVCITRKDGKTVPVEYCAGITTYQGKVATIAYLRDITERKRAEEKYRQLLEDMNDGYIVYQDRGIVLANRRFAEIYGYTVEQVLGKDLFTFVAPNSLQAMLEKYTRVMSGEEEALEQYKIEGKKEDGTEIITEASVKAIQYEGKPAFSVIVRDITERTRMEKELQDSEQHHRVLVEMASNLGEGIIIALDVEGNRGTIVFTDDAVTKILGYSKEELLQMCFLDLVAPASAQEMAKRYIQRQVGDKLEEHYESVVLAKKGTEVPVQVETGNTTYLGKPAIITFIRDITERKQMEAQLREYSKSLEWTVEDRTLKLGIAEENYRAVFEYAGDAIIVTDNNSVVQLWNKEAERMFGYKAEEMVGEKWHMIVPEELQGEIVWLADEIKQKGYIKNYMTERVRKNGRKLAVELTSTVLRDIKGKPIGFSTILRDITVRKLMEEQQRILEGEKEKTQKALALSEERYRSVFEHSGLAMGIYDKNGVVQFLNKEAERIFGYTAEELVGVKTPLVIPEDLLQEAMWLNTEVEEKGYVDGYETERLRKDGTRFPVELTIASLKNNNGNTTSYSFIGRDITERKRLGQEKDKAKKALALSEERYRAVVEHSGLAMGISNNKGAVQFLNKEAEIMFGYTAEELTGEEAFRVSIPEDLLEETEKLMREVKEKGYVDSYETERLRKDGTRFPVELTFASLRNEKGETIGLTFIAKDITERKRLEQEKEEAQQRLTAAERLAAIGELASIVGHELRNPLAVIGNSVYYLKMKSGDSDEKVKKHLEILEAEVAISSRIISNILDFARPKQPVFQDTDINTVIERALEKYALPENVKVVTELEKDLSQIAADADQLQQVFINLISNAAQAMPEGGKLLVRTTQRDNLIRVEFEDTGIGISPENLEKIFRPMFSTKAKGIGLGLTISKRIVESHHGKLEFSSQVGQGTTFIITLPIGGKNE